MMNFWEIYCVPVIDLDSLAESDFVSQLISWNIRINFNFFYFNLYELPFSNRIKFGGLIQSLEVLRFTKFPPIWKYESMIFSLMATLKHSEFLPKFCYHFNLLTSWNVNLRRRMPTCSFFLGTTVSDKNCFT